MKKRRIYVLFSSCTVSIAGLVLGACGGGSSWSAPSTNVSPTGNALVAQYTITAPRPNTSAWVEFGTDTHYGRQTSATTPTTGYGQSLSVLVAGMRSNTTYHLRAHVEWPFGGSWVDQDRTFTTGVLPKSLAVPGITVTRPNSNLTPSPGIELLSLAAPAQTSMLQTFATDLQGNVIWYYPLAALPIKPMQNGHLIANLATDLREIDLAGTTIRDVSVTQVNQSLQAGGYSFSITSFSHDVLTLDNGHWIGLATTSKDFTDLPGYPGTMSVVGDALVDIDPNNYVVWGWSAFDHLDVNRHLQGLPDWTHSNALVLTPEGDILLSMRHQSWILKIDYSNGAGAGDILWRLGNDGDFALAQDDPNEWFYAQHYPNLLSTNGSQMTLAIWDNGNLRVNSQMVSCGSSPSAPSCYSRATIFQLDESTRVATLLWDDTPGFYSWWGGSIGTLGNGDVEFDMTIPTNSTSSQIMEVTQTDNPETVWQFNLTGENAYRGYRVPSLYPGVLWNQ